MADQKQAQKAVKRQAAEGHGGDVTPKEAWRVLSADPAAQLVDVRSAAEWTFVGVPDLGALHKKVQFVEWQRFPGMVRIAEFVDVLIAGLKKAGTIKTAPIFFICRSGHRSASAARALTALGFSATYNIAGGFEGDLDDKRHRAGVSGWKFDGLPWVQS
ncbi:hypothetical protein MNBD_ALPHA09-2267 [hydrothermal vent metagenome]|uniref:Rhodanese domain-containing protein n=1 Tax=hydrothermal vent metagenome TaxID=652676 RepID=A0A3B0TDH9_9ZZZZ